MASHQPLKMNIIVAVCEANNGIGIGGALPWRLRKEAAFFKRITTSISTPQEQTPPLTKRQNAVLMGRRVWQSIPERFRPLSDRVNVVLSRTLQKGELKDAYVCASMEEAMELLNSPPLIDQVETVWNLGGNEVYRLGLESPFLDRVYVTKIESEFVCDVFFPVLDAKKFVRTTDERVSTETQEENGVKFRYKIYKKV